MEIKDYYTILEVSPSASLHEIKKAYRRLAQLYHPDKNDNDRYAAAQFAVIKEAYEVLTNPSQKEQYLQQRWYNQSIGKRRTGTMITPVTVLKQVLELDKYVSTLDVHRMDKQGLYEYIAGIIPDDTIEKLNAFKEISINKEIVSGLLNCISSLPIHLAKNITSRLLCINTDEVTVKKINDSIRLLHKANRWERYRVLILLLTALLLCLLMFFFK